MDRPLARRLERTEAAINASFIEARAVLSPEVGATWTEIAGTYLLFDGPASPMTQTFGLGLSEAVTPALLASMEAFFFDRGADTFHEVSPLAGAATFAALSQRGYHPIELTTVLVQPLHDERGQSRWGRERPQTPARGARPAAPLPPDLQVRAAVPGEADLWIETSIAGWATTPELGEHIRKVATVAFRNPAVTSFLVERDNRPIATGALGVHEGTALLAGASTIPPERGRGAQRALLEARLSEARRRGCSAAVMGAEPGSTSQRNAERNGFRVAYTRVKWRLSREASPRAA